MLASWVTDIHLNFATKDTKKAFYADVIHAKPDCLFITGDIGESTTTLALLTEMQKAINIPIYYVCGNHDYYGSSVKDMREIYSNPRNNLFYLTSLDPIFLSDNTALVGVDGWADGIYGDYENSPVILNDSRMIDELSQGLILKMSGYHKQSKHMLLKNMQDLANKDARLLIRKLYKAVKKKPKTIIILTHIPPYDHCCRYDGKATDDDFLPFYSSKATGNVIDAYAKKHPDIKFLVLCGHTHDKCVYEHKNIKVMVGEAQYYMPEVQCEIEY